MNVMLDFIVWTSPSCEEWAASEKFKMKIYESSGNRTNYLSHVILGLG